MKKQYDFYVFVWTFALNKNPNSNMDNWGRELIVYIIQEKRLFVKMN